MVKYMTLVNTNVEQLLKMLNRHYTMFSTKSLYRSSFVAIFLKIIIKTFNKTCLKKCFKIFVSIKILICRVINLF